MAAGCSQALVLEQLLAEFLNSSASSERVSGDRGVCVEHSEFF